MVPESIKEVLPDVPDKNKLWAWGLGAVIGIPAVAFVFQMHRADKEYYREQFVGAVEKAEESRDKGDEKIAGVLAQIAKSFDTVGDNILLSTEVQRQQLYQDIVLAKETDDLGDEIRAMNKANERQSARFEQFLEVIENNHDALINGKRP